MERESATFGLGETRSKQQEEQEGSGGGERCRIVKAAQLLDVMKMERIRHCHRRHLVMRVVVRLRSEAAERVKVEEEEVVWRSGLEEYGGRL